MTVPPAGQSCNTCSNYLGGKCHYPPPESLHGDWISVDADDWCSAWGLTIGEGVAAATVLTQDTIYYVRSDGSDSNTGLVDDANGAFLTVPYAMSVIAGLNANGHTITVQSRLSSQSASVTLPYVLNPNKCYFQGDTGTPSNCEIATVGNPAIYISGANGRTHWYVQGFKLTTITSGDCITIDNGARLDYSACEFGASAGYCVQAQGNGSEGVNDSADITISGNCSGYAYAYGGAILWLSGANLTISDPVTVSDSFCKAGVNATICIEYSSYTNKNNVTGRKFYLSDDGHITTNTGDNDYLPGDGAGIVGTGCTYN